MDEIDFLTVSNPAPSPITEEELATFLAVGKTWQVEEDEYEKEAERAYQLTILDRQRDEIHQREAERDAREADRDQREADRDKREEERDASPDDFHDGWMKRVERAKERDVRKALRDTREVERKRCKKLADARRQAEMDRREAERDKREAERDRLAREVDLQAYKANGENRVTLVKAVRAQRASFDDRGENDDVFPDAYIKYLSGLTGASSLSDEGKIIEKARELYKKHEPERRNGTFYDGWIGQEKLDEYIFNNWIKEKQSNSVIFNEYINMAKKENERERLEKEEKLKREKLNRERLKQEKIELQERLEQERLKKQEHLEQERLEQERLEEKERLEKPRRLEEKKQFLLKRFRTEYPTLNYDEVKHIDPEIIEELETLIKKLSK